MRTAVVEVGTAALRAVVVEPTEGGWFRVHAEHRVVLGLLRAVRRDGQLGEGLLQLLEETARRLREACFRSGADEVSGRIAAGLARAADAEELRGRTATALGVDVRLTDPADEGQGLLDAVAARTAPRWPSVVVDLGDVVRALRVDAAGQLAGMVELDEAVRDLLPAGTVDPYHPAVRGHLRARVHDLFARLPAAPDPSSWPVVTGPAVDALARAMTSRRWGCVDLDHDGALLSRAALQAFELELTSSTVTQRMLLPAVDPAEVDLAALGVVLVQGILDRTGTDGALVSRGRAQDGLILRAMCPHGSDAGSPPRGENRTAVRAAAIAERRPTEHAELTATIAGRLHAQAAEDGAPARVDEREQLLLAARLHDARPGPAGPTTGAAALLRVGLRGFGPAELVELATLVGATCAGPAVPHEVPTARLPARRREAVARSASLLRLACRLATEQVATVPATPTWSSDPVEAVP
jgi:exopolyphosphatase/pppGpp-phosphohydrolase